MGSVALWFIVLIVLGVGLLVVGLVVIPNLYPRRTVVLDDKGKVYATKTFDR